MQIVEDLSEDIQVYKIINSADTGHPTPYIYIYIYIYSKERLEIFVALIIK